MQAYQLIYENNIKAMKDEFLTERRKLESLILEQNKTIMNQGML